MTYQRPIDGFEDDWKKKKRFEEQVQIPWNMNMDSFEWRY